MKLNEFNGSWKKWMNRCKLYSLYIYYTILGDSMDVFLSRSLQVACAVLSLPPRSMKAALFSSHSAELLDLNCSARELRAIGPPDVLEQLMCAGEQVTWWHDDKMFDDFFFFFFFFLWLLLLLLLLLDSGLSAKELKDMGFECRELVDFFEVRHLVNATFSKAGPWVAVGRNLMKFVHVSFHELSPISGRARRLPKDPSGHSRSTASGCLGLGKGSSTFVNMLKIRFYWHSTVVECCVAFSTVDRISAAMCLKMCHECHIKHWQVMMHPNSKPWTSLWKIWPTITTQLRCFELAFARIGPNSD